MIVVTGATGQLGGLIVGRLLERVPAGRVAVSVRDPAKAKSLADRGVRVRRGDFAEPASLAHAFEGARQVLIVSSNAAAHGGDPLAQHRAAIAAARDAGAARVVYTSQVAASPTSAFPPAVDHAATEEMLGQSGLAWTSLRDGFHAAAIGWLFGDALRAGVVEAPADGRVSWVTHADLAEAAAVVLADEGRFDGPTPPLTGSAAVDLADLAGLASDVLGRPVRRVTLSDDDMRARLAARGLPPKVIALMMSFYLASRDGEFAAVDPTLGQLIGRPPQPVGEVLAPLLAS